MTNEEQQGSRGQPLWLPRGSIRAVIALAVVGVWAVLEIGAIGSGGASDAVRSMMIAVAAGYGVLRDRDRQSGDGGGA